MKMRGVIISLVAVAAAAGAYGIYHQRNSKETEPKYRTEKVEIGTVSETVTATGTISPVTTVQVGSQVSGIISKIYVDFNSPVTKGQLLAELDPTPFELQVQQRQADLQQAQVQMRNAGVQLERNERLLAQKLVAEADYDAAKANYESMKAQTEQAEAALKQSQTNLSYAKIYSPINGVVVARQYDIGQTVAASFQAPTLFSIAEDLTKMEVQADVDQSDISRVATGQTARFTVDAYPEETFVGKISQIRLNATQNQNVITYPVMVEVHNPDGKLKPKMTADVTVEVAKVADVLRIPNAALRFKPIEVGRAGDDTGDAPPATRAVQGSRARGAARAAEALGAGRPARRQQTVYVVLAENKLKPVEIRTGISDGRFTSVTEGDLKAGDKIAVGLATARADQQGAPLGMGGRGGGRRF
jgi:HlyD family secretion protein